VSKKLSFILFFVVLLALGLGLAFIGPRELVGMLGVQNSLLVAFLVSLLGGVSTFTSASFFAVIGGLALGGIPLLSLMVVCGPALLIGDLVFYFFGKTTYGVLPAKTKRWLQKVEVWVQEGRNFPVQLGIVLYTGFSPFPGDILMMVLAIAKYPFRRMWLPLLFGNMMLVWSIGQAAIGSAKLF